MFRIRRYRLFLICAVVIVFLLYRVGQNTGWDATAGESFYDSYASKPRANPDYEAPDKSRLKPSEQKVVKGENEGYAAPPPSREEQPIVIPELKTSVDVKASFGLPTPTKTRTSSSQRLQLAKTPIVSPAPTKPASNYIPDRVPGRVGDVFSHAVEDDDLHIQKPPGKYQRSSLHTTSTIHWRRVPEHFPVPTESIIPLPTGKPKAMPAVQYTFKEEPPVAKDKRESRLAQVKVEMSRAWEGYKTYAWGHDEVKPVSKKFRDPFCGWAATLVDAMDTLWIMGMKTEFNEAYAALNDIDFTTTPHRTEIPVFETVIRYLGGLIAAFDVTGGHDGDYPLLLNKAVELAEILMGVFDTPNRMPILYYNWNPAHASQPHRASTSAGVAELGSMSMEFTRLAQLTGENKYYDAIARITDALEEFQNRPNGTTLPGIFPQNIDASGCNRTATPPVVVSSSTRAKAQAQRAGKTEPQGYRAGQAVSETDDAAVREDVAEDGVLVQNGETSPVKITKTVKKDVDADDMDDTAAVSDGTDTLIIPASAKHEGGVDAPLKANGLPDGWDCVSQNLTAGGYGMETFSMGGSQDSAYEYFPKQYILLGGLEPKYRTMHEKTVEAVKKFLLYRPMIKDENRHLLFSAKVYASNRRSYDTFSADYEITHLTCFLGGMFGLGGKLFDRPEDVDIGAKLADGCAWAYETMPTGIMPESAYITPCEDSNNCPWNETAWYERLDPNPTWRLDQMKDYQERVAKWGGEKRKALLAEAERQLALEAMETMSENRPVNSTVTGTLEGSDTIAKRDIDTSGPAYAIEAEVAMATAKQSLTDAQIEARAKQLEEELDRLSSNDAQGSFGGTGGQTLLTNPNILPPEPVKPQTHEEFVAQRIERDHLVPGFTSLMDPRYILRPEAIESVWYMYRITGDPEWQEKGWRMFQAVIKATTTEVAHSAIDNVARLEKPTFSDNMESFWMAETLKYYYLLFSEPDVISLDEWVLNTEAHPFKLPS